jgi:hypothetical protein
MTGRYFPDDHEVDQWIASRFLNETDIDTSSPRLDQLIAATADTINRFQTGALGMVAEGKAEWVCAVPDEDRTKVRGAVRQIMAAESVGITQLCPHINMIRPQVIICDPPIIVCAECLPSRCPVIETLGHVWNHECDRCGVHVQMLTPTAVGGLGHFTVHGHVCGSCAADDQRHAFQGADKVVVIDRGNRRVRRRRGVR